MTKTTDKQLDKWLDAYKVDTSATRLNRLEEDILSRIATQANALFVPMGWKEKIMTGIGVCGIALMVTLAANWTPSTSDYSLSSAYSQAYGGY